MVLPARVLSGHPVGHPDAAGSSTNSGGGLKLSSQLCPLNLLSAGARGLAGEGGGMGSGDRSAVTARPRPQGRRQPRLSLAGLTSASPL